MAWNIRQQDITVLLAPSTELQSGGAAPLNCVMNHLVDRWVGDLEPARWERLSSGENSIEDDEEMEETLREAQEECLTSEQIPDQAFEGFSLMHVRVIRIESGSDLEFSVKPLSVTPLKLSKTNTGVTRTDIERERETLQACPHPLTFSSDGAYINTCNAHLWGALLARIDLQLSLMAQETERDQKKESPKDKRPRL